MSKKNPFVSCMWCVLRSYPKKGWYLAAWWTWSYTSTAARSSSAGASVTGRTTYWIAKISCTYRSITDWGLWDSQAQVTMYCQETTASRIRWQPSSGSSATSLRSAATPVRWPSLECRQVGLVSITTPCHPCRWVSRVKYFACYINFKS